MSASPASPHPAHKLHFFGKFGITERLLERCLGEALSAGGDYADLYFESVTAISKWTSHRANLNADLHAH